MLAQLGKSSSRDFYHTINWRCAYFSVFIRHSCYILAGLESKCTRFIGVNSNSVILSVIWYSECLDLQSIIFVCAFVQCLVHSFQYETWHLYLHLYKCMIQYQSNDWWIWNTSHAGTLKYCSCKSDVWLTVHRNSVWIRKTD